jgi:hypothetical protein
VIGYATGGRRSPSGALDDPPGLGVDWALLANLAAGASNPLDLLLRSIAHLGFGRVARLAQLREQIEPGRGGAIIAPGRRGPHDGAIGQLLIAPSTGSAVKGLEPVMIPNC